MTPAWLRPLADADLIERSRYYAAEAGEDVAKRFFDSAISTLRAVERMPGTGSPRVGELCDIPGLRMRRVEGFRCGWYYFVRSEHLDVVRLLADVQDLTAILEALDDEQ
ncbi:MAG TPA: type II toxin-antitoxin system RelE/ParE family toxin [Ilumatobacteraceae bacterium]|nr:type II toxin-antitoxin system RelE/ParE family toxin [Ilumatobacteraceae bacterium]